MLVNIVKLFLNDEYFVYNIILYKYNSVMCFSINSFSLITLIILFISIFLLF